MDCNLRILKLERRLKKQRGELAMVEILLLHLRVKDMLNLPHFL